MTSSPLVILNCFINWFTEGDKWDFELSCYAYTFPNTSLHFEPFAITASQLYKLICLIYFLALSSISHFLAFLPSSWCPLSPMSLLYTYFSLFLHSSWDSTEITYLSRHLYSAQRHLNSFSCEVSWNILFYLAPSFGGVSFIQYRTPTTRIVCA